MTWQRAVIALASHWAAWGTTSLDTGHCRVCPECQGLAHDCARPLSPFPTLSAHHTYTHTHTHTSKSGTQQLPQECRPSLGVPAPQVWAERPVGPQAVRSRQRQVTLRSQSPRAPGRAGTFAFWDDSFERVLLGSQVSTGDASAAVLPGLTPQAWDPPGAWQPGRDGRSDVGTPGVPRSPS